MASFHHASHFKRLSKNIPPDETISVLEMAATFQIYNCHENAPTKSNLVTIKIVYFQD